MEKIWRLAGCFQYDSKPADWFCSLQDKSRQAEHLQLFFKLLEETGVYAGKGKGKLSFGRNFVHKQIRN